MKKKILIIGMLVLMVGVGLFGCAPPPAAPPVTPPPVTPPPEATIKPCEVGVPVIETEHAASAEVIVLSPVFAISNPNDYAVTVKRLRYTALVDGALAGDRELVLNICVPAKDESTIMGGVLRLFAGAGHNVQGYISGAKGISLQDAYVELVPLWKNLGGKLYDGTWARVSNEELKAAWDAAPKEIPVFTITGRIEMRSPGGQELSADYSVTWHMPAEVKAGE